MHSTQHRLGGASLAALLSATVACAPGMGPRLSVTPDGALVKGGQRGSMGYFGDGLVGAVSDDPAARAEAQAYRTYSIAGFSVGVTGGAAVIVGAGVATGAHGTRQDAGWATAGAGGAIALVGLIVAGLAIPHFHRAFNLYNWGAPERPLPGAPTPEPAPVAPAAEPPAPPPASASPAPPP